MVSTKFEWFKKYRSFDTGLPSEDTIARVIKLIDPVALNQSFMAWVNSIRSTTGQPQIAIDGKTLKLSRDGEKQNALHSITAWCQQSGLVLAQMKSVGKKNEHTSVLEILDLLNIEGAIITVDTMNTQKKIAQKIVEKKADYIFCIKNNHKLLKQEIAAYFHKIQRDSPDLIQVDEDIDSGHALFVFSLCPFRKSSLR